MSKKKNTFSLDTTPLASDYNGIDPATIAAIIALI